MMEGMRAMYVQESYSSKIKFLFCHLCRVEGYRVLVHPNPLTMQSLE